MSIGRSGRPSTGVRPPRSIAGQPGPGDWQEIGRQWAQHLREWGGLEADQHVLDVGCGAGRVAMGLLEAFGPTLRYDGFDVQRRAIRFCRRSMGRRWPAAQFRRVDVYNRVYNPRGRIVPEAFVFPYDDDVFDVAHLSSVFTHLLPTTIDHYLREINRVLRPGGRCVSTFFVLNDTTRAATPEYREVWFDHEGPDGCRLWQAERPEAAVAYEEAHVRRLVSGAGLNLVEPLRFGSWSGAAGLVGAPEFQDTVVATKPGPSPSVGVDGAG